MPSPGVFRRLASELQFAIPIPRESVDLVAGEGYARWHPAGPPGKGEPKEVEHDDC